MEPSTSSPSLRSFAFVVIASKVQPPLIAHAHSCCAPLLGMCESFSGNDYTTLHDMFWSTRSNLRDCSPHLA